MSLFKTPTNEALYFTPAAGTYIGELKSIEPFDKGQYGPSLKWSWVLFDINSKEPVVFNDKPAVFDALSGTDMSLGAKARKWANVHLAPHREVEPGEDPDALARELLGKRVRINFTLDVDKNNKEVVKMTSVLAYTG